MNFERGFDPVRDKLKKRSPFVMSCYNCDYYYQAMGDDRELCQNDQVLQYDMVISNNNICCHRWKPATHKEEVKPKSKIKLGGKKREQEKAVSKTRKNGSKRT